MGSLELKLEEHNKAFNKFRDVLGIVEQEPIKAPPQQKKSRPNYFIVFIAIVVAFVSCSVTYTKIIL